MKKKSKAKKIVLALATGLVLWTGAKMAGQNRAYADDSNRIVAQRYESEDEEDEKDSTSKKPTMPERPDSASQEENSSDQKDADESDMDNISKTNTDRNMNEKTSREIRSSEAVSSPDSSSDREPDSHSGIRPEFQRAMDEYEKYFQDYADFMVRLSQNPNDLDLIMEMAEWTENLVSMEDEFNALENDSSDWSAQEYECYFETSARIQKLLLEASQKIGE